MNRPLPEPVDAVLDADDVHAERRAFRAGRVRLAFFTSAGSKALGLLVQFLAVPLAVRSLGPERFGLYTMLVSALVWIDLGRLGIGPGLTRELALAWNRDERERERTIFSNAMFFLFGMAGLIGIALLLGYHAGAAHLDVVFGPSVERYRGEIVAGIAVVGLFLVAQVIFSAGEAARSAYQDDFINNLMNALANLASLLLVFWVALWMPTIWAFALAVFGAIALGKGVNLALLLTRSRPYLFPRWRFVDRGSFRLLLGSSIAFWVAQVAVLLMHNLSLVQLGQSVGAQALTPFAVVFRLLQLLSTAVLMISMPLWPAITDAAVRGDREWIVASYRRLVTMALLFSGAVAIGIALLGSTLIPLWAGATVQVDPMLSALLGAYFVIWMWNHCHSTVLFGLGRLWPVAWIMLVEGLAVLGLAMLLIPRYGATGTAMALCLAGVLVSGWLLPLVLRRTLARPFDVSATSSAAPPAGPTLSEEPIP
ncbi:lipopolysaccharide biosynthesis protein (plasmid) [Sphingomonas pseudosanguinis]|uniref:lipopolysaccharide biosynthesis protein n=1 Tax=Sphingomonas pseudosanguinis TaxID=413712 RepID=UPI003F83D3D1